MHSLRNMDISEQGGGADADGPGCRALISGQYYLEGFFLEPLTC